MKDLKTLLALFAQGKNLEESWSRAGFSSSGEASRALEHLARSLGDSGSRAGNKTLISKSGALKDAHPGLERAIVHVDGASRGNPGPSAVAAVLYLPSGEEVCSAAKKIGHATNNVAEYRAVLEGIRLARELAVRDITIRLDSELVLRQLTGQYRTRDADLAALAREISQEARVFEGCRFEHVPREQNKEADRLANQALDRVIDP